MSRITLDIPDDLITETSRKAGRLGVSNEELIQFTIGEIIGRPDEDFELALKHILDKNAELYKRLSRRDASP